MLKRYFFIFLLVNSFYGLQAENIIINEIMYHPTNGDMEWIELYNCSDDAIDISAWYIIDNNSNHNPIFLPQGTVMTAKSYFTVAIDKGDFLPFIPDYDGTGNFSLNNKSDEVNLYDDNNVLIDKIVYADSSPWPSNADGDGFSLELNNTSNDNNIAENWRASSILYGTPGTANSTILTKPFLRIIWPNGNNYLQKNTEYTIVFGRVNYSGPVSVELLKNNVVTKIIKQHCLNDSALWTVPFNINPANYKIRVVAEKNNSCYDSSDNTFNIIETMKTPQLVITEIMYNPPCGNDSLEYIEVYNNDKKSINLEGMYLSDGVEYHFPSIKLKKNEYFLIAKDSMAFYNTMGLKAGQWSGALDNDGEILIIRNKYDAIIDYVKYDNTPPWDTLATGYGPSLVLCDADADNSLPKNWTTSINHLLKNNKKESVYGSPKQPCLFIGNKDFEEKILIASLHPNPVMDTLKIDMKNNSNYHVNIFSGCGVLISEKDFTGNINAINFSSLPKGFYIVEIEDKNTDTNKTLKVNHY